MTLNSYLQQYLVSRSEFPSETHLPFFNMRFICILQLKRNPCIATKHPHPQDSEAFVTSPKQDVVATFIPLPEGRQLLSWCWPMAHNNGACSAMTNQLPRGLWGSLVFRGSERYWIMVPRVENKQKKENNHDSHYPKEKVKEQGRGDYRPKPHKHTYVSANTTRRMSVWLPLLWSAKKQQKSSFPKQRSTTITKWTSVVRPSTMTPNNWILLSKLTTC